MQTLHNNEENLRNITTVEKSGMMTLPPVYGHLLTADQLVKIENHHNHHQINQKVSVNKTHGRYQYPSLSSPSSICVESENSDKYFLESNSTSYYQYPQFQRNVCRKSSSYLVKLSVDLIQTYKEINEIYYRKKRKSHHNNNNSRLNNCPTDFSQQHLPQHLHHNKSYNQHNHQQNLPHTDFCNSENSTSTNIISKDPASSEIGGDYVVKHGDILRNQFCVDKLIGTGSFGQVVRAKDLKTGEMVAVKIIRNKRNFIELAHFEIKLLREISRFQETDELALQTGANYIVKLKSYFTHHGTHLCLVFELLTFTLYELLRNTHFRGVSLNLTRKFIQQICQALIFLRDPPLEIIHCDLKPENILLVHPRRSAIKVVDFGSSCHANKRIFYYIQSRFYRSPEILLNMDYSHPIDMWSLGCIMAELHTGQPLFVSQCEHEQILKIVEVMGMPSVEMLNRGKKTPNYFDRIPSVSTTSGDKSTPTEPNVDTTRYSTGCNNSSAAFTYAPKLYRDKDGRKISFRGVSSRQLSDIFKSVQSRRMNDAGHSDHDYSKFLDLLNRMLQLDPELRIKPHEAINHPFFTKSTAAIVATGNNNNNKLKYNRNVDVMATATGMTTTGCSTIAMETTSPTNAMLQHCHANKNDGTTINTTNHHPHSHFIDQAEI